MRSWNREFGVPIEIRPDDRFLCTHDEFQSWGGWTQTITHGVFLS